MTMDMLLSVWCALSSVAQATEPEEAVCATVKIEIQQELTLERQGFDAEMKINNALS